MFAGPMLAKPQDLTFCDEAESPAICSTVESIHGYSKTIWHSCYPSCQSVRVMTLASDESHYPEAKVAFSLDLSGPP